LNLPGMTASTICFRSALFCFSGGIAEYSHHPAAKALKRIAG
jgi:hypothetical protein